MHAYVYIYIYLCITLTMQLYVSSSVLNYRFGDFCFVLGHYLFTLEHH